LSFLVQLKYELAVVHDSADGRLGTGCDFHEIQSGTFGASQRFLNRHDTDLFTIGADDADFRRSNFRIASYALTLDDSELLTLSLKTSAVVCGDEQIEILVSRSPTAVPSSVLGCSNTTSPVQAGIVRAGPNGHKADAALKAFDFRQFEQRSPGVSRRSWSGRCDQAAPPPLERHG
jgi:hypothetical protein